MHESVIREYQRRRDAESYSWKEIREEDQGRRTKENKNHATRLKRRRRDGMLMIIIFENNNQEALSNEFATLNLVFILLC